MKPRITLNTNSDGLLEIWLNPAGRDLLVQELQRLAKTRDHFHFGPENLTNEVPIQKIAYHECDQIIEWGKVMLRLDEWDAEYFPHVLSSDLSDGR